MNWEKIKNNVTKEKPLSFYDITNAEYFEKWQRSITWEWITEDSQITVKGYSVYAGTCLALNKTSILGGPLAKSKAPEVPDNLVNFEIIKFNGEINDYELDFDGPGYLEVLIRCIRGQGSPKFDMNFK